MLRNDNTVAVSIIIVSDLWSAVEISHFEKDWLIPPLPKAIEGDSIGWEKGMDFVEMFLEIRDLIMNS